jgi:hypothetical protein
MNEIAIINAGNNCICNKRFATKCDNGHQFSFSSGWVSVGF